MELARYNVIEYLEMIKSIRPNINIRDIHGDGISLAVETLPALSVPAKNPAAKLVGDE